jgi:hypothetical protein
MATVELDIIKQQSKKLLPNQKRELIRYLAEGLEPKKNGLTGGIREMFGTWSSGDPHSADNDKIDADLARAYADNHEDED